MKFKENSKSKKSVSTIVLNVAASLVVLIAIAALANNIILFKNTVNQYVAQGYSYNEVIKQLIPMQLLPDVFEPIAVYGGIALILFAAGVINEKVSKCFIMLSNAQANNEVIEESDIEDSIIVVNNIEPLDQTETIEEVNGEVEEVKEAVETANN